MGPIVEPREGAELDRLITALLNATGVVHRVVEAADADGPPDADGEEIIGLAAARLRSMLAVLSEHHGDHEIASATAALAEITVVVASQLGLKDCFEGP
jgi:hypothetical protein